MSAPNFQGGLKFWGGVCSKFSGGLKFWGGVCSKFSGGVSAQNFGGGFCSEFFGGSEIFFLFFSIYFPPKKFLLGCTPPPRDGQCVAGMHPTGMHSCFFLLFTVRKQS